MVYSSPVNNTGELPERIENRCQVVLTKPEIFKKVRKSLTRRCEACVEIKGHVEKLL